MLVQISHREPTNPHLLRWRHRFSSGALPRRTTRLHLDQKRYSRKHGKLGRNRQEVDVKPQAAIYARLSSDPSGTSISVPEQIRRCREAAGERGFTVPDSLVFADRSVSASKASARRPGYDTLIATLKAGTVNTVFVRETSRLYRRPGDLETLIALMEGKGLTIVPLFSSDQKLDTALERNDVLTARIMAAVDAEESAKLSKRVRMAKAARRDAGYINGGGRRPFGYRTVAGSGLEVVPEEAALIREAADRIISGENPARIITDWNDRGVLTAGGHRWRTRTLWIMLIGRAEKRGTPLSAGGKNWPAILTQDEVALVRAQLVRPRAGKNATPAFARGRRRHPLTGLLFCRECGLILRGSNNIYRCSRTDGGCGKVAIATRALERYLDREIQTRRDFGLALDPATPQPPDPATPDRDALLAELRAVEAQIENLAGQLAAASSPTASRVVERAIEMLAAREESARAAIAVVVPTTGPTPDTWEALYGGEDDLYRRWDARELTDTEVLDLHALFASYIERVPVKPRDPGRRIPINERVEIVWRPGVVYRPLPPTGAA